MREAVGPFQSSIAPSFIDEITRHVTQDVERGAILTNWWILRFIKFLYIYIYIHMEIINTLYQQIVGKAFLTLLVHLMNRDIVTIDYGIGL